MLGDGVGEVAGQTADGWTEEGRGDDLFQLFPWPHAWEWPGPLPAAAGLKRRYELSMTSTYANIN